jgi:hypothetical protein
VCYLVADILIYTALFLAPYIAVVNRWTINRRLIIALGMLVVGLTVFLDVIIKTPPIYITILALSIKQIILTKSN